MRHRARARVTLGLPLMRAGRALRQFPFVAEQMLEEVVAEFRRRGGPGDFEAAGDRIDAQPGVEAAAPAKTLVLEIIGFRIHRISKLDHF